MSDLESRLIDANDSPKTFSISSEDLSLLMDLDSIRENKSLEKLKTMKGNEGLANMLKVNLKAGLNPEDAHDFIERIKEYGDNKPIARPTTTICEFITECLEDKILKILLAASAVSLVIGILTEGIETGWIEGFAIFIAVFIIVSVTAINNYLKEKQFRKLYAQLDDREVNVIRQGKIHSISIYDLLVGDIMKVDTGEVFPADGVLISGFNMTVDESAMTGESDLMHKFALNLKDEFQTKGNPFLISGSKVMEGTGEMIVIAVGERSFQGKQKKLMMEEKKEESPLQQKLAVLADQIGYLGTVAAGGMFILMILHMIIEKIINGEALFNANTLNYIVNSFILAIVIIVVAVPEGLPLAVTISLAYSMDKMRKENNFVRYLQACETMGGANNICTDKTGTLTKNQMTVTNLFLEEVIHSHIDKKNIRESTLELLCEGICFNSNALPKITRTSFEHNGNKTECALLEMAYNMGFNYEKYRPSDKIKKMIPFSSARKKMTAVVQMEDELIRVYSKGAPDVLLDKCSEYINEEGMKSKMTPEFKGRVMDKVIKSYANQSLRTLLFAYKDLKPKSKDVNYDSLNEEFLEDDLVFIGIAGIKDPLREEIPNAIKKCKSASITVRMVTGDNIDTAIAISKDAGIIPKDYEHNEKSFVVMEGKNFRNYVGGLVKGKEDEQPKVSDIGAFEIVAKELRVLARSSPEDKYLLVTGLKQLNNVVAVTGDGTNDAPALKKADIGLAMGIAGTEVAKEAAGIILMDDNFNSIVTAVKWGRNIFDSIRKFLIFQLTVNVVGVFMCFLGGAVLKESPLNAVQMLWVNLVQDTFAALALATEEPTEEVLKRPPYARDDHMISPLMWRNIIGQGLFHIILLTVFLFQGDTWLGIPSGRNNAEWTYENGIHYTLFFEIFVFLQLFNEINARKLKKDEYNAFAGFWKNPLFLIIFWGTLFVQILLVQTGGYAVRCTPLTWDYHLFCLGVGFLSIPFQILLKLLPESLFEKISCLQVKPESLENLMREETFVEKLKKPSKSRSFMRSKSRGDGFSRGSFKKIM